ALRASRSGGAPPAPPLGEVGRVPRPRPPPSRPRARSLGLPDPPPVPRRDLHAARLRRPAGPPFLPPPPYPRSPPPPPAPSPGHPLPAPNPSFSPRLGRAPSCATACSSRTTPTA